VLGVPVQSKTLNGLDSLLSIVQMPAGVPVATFAIGTAGAANAGLMATAILALKHSQFQAPLDAFRAARRTRSWAIAIRASAADAAQDGDSMTIGIVGAGQLGRMTALAGYPLGLDFLFLDASASTPGGQVAPILEGAFTDSALLRRTRTAQRGRDLRLGERVGRRASRRSASSRENCSRRCGARRLAGPPEREAAVRPARHTDHALRRGRTPAICSARFARIGLPGVLKTRRFGYDGKGQAGCMRTADDARRRADLAARRR
jgi:hypothetical protein